MPLSNRLPDYRPLCRYARVSSDDQHMELSIGAQLAKMQKYTARNHERVVDACRGLARLRRQHDADAIIDDFMGNQGNSRFTPGR